jgi:NAD-dependent DNA ligase
MNKPPATPIEKYLDLPLFLQLVEQNGIYVFIYRVNGYQKIITREAMINQAKPNAFPPLVQREKGNENLLRFVTVWIDKERNVICWVRATLNQNEDFDLIQWKKEESPIGNQADILMTAIVTWVNFVRYDGYRVMFPSDEELANQIFGGFPNSPASSTRPVMTTAPNGKSYYDFVQESSKEEIDRWFDQLDKAYYCGEALLADEIYDNLVGIYESRFGKRLKVRTEPSHGAVPYVIAMASLDKVKEEKELRKFTNENPGPYVVMEKVDGNSALYGSNFLYYGGNSSQGNDISFMLQYLNLPKIPEGVYIKGELVIDKAVYEPYKQEYKTNLSMIAGLLNSRSADPQKLKLFRFIAYDMTGGMTMSQNLMALQQHGFTIPACTAAQSLSIEWLSSVYKHWKSGSNYNIDGLVIASDRAITPEERQMRDNPKYACAFKEYGETAVATVINVIWEASKHGMIKPVVEIEPVTINNFTIRRLTAFNAGWVAVNNVGPGTKLLITHNTIPHVLKVIQGTGASLPPNPETWRWNDTQVDIVLLEENDEMRIARIYEFFKQIGAKFVGETTLAKFYYAGFTTVKSILEAGREGLLRAGIPGIGEGIVDRMLENTNIALTGITLSRLMSASCEFGNGFGNRKLVLITNNFPNILFETPTISQIVAIQGFAEKTATKFLEGLPRFKTWLANNPILMYYLQNSQVLQAQQKQAAQAAQIQYQQQISQQPNTNNNVQRGNVESVDGKTIVFTGFRDERLKSQIENLGGKVTDSVSNRTTCVVVGGAKGIGSGKEKEAIKRGIPVISVEELRAKYNLY